MSEGSISFSVDLDVDQAEHRIALLKSSIKKVAMQFEGTKVKKSSLEIQADNAKEALQDARRVLKIMETDLENAEKGTASYKEIKLAIEDQIAVVDKLKKEWDKVNDSLEKVNADYQAQSAYLEEAYAELEGLQATVAQAEAEQKAADEAERQAEAEQKAADAAERQAEAKKKAADAARGQSRDESCCCCCDGGQSRGESCCCCGGQQKEKSEKTENSTSTDISMAEKSVSSFFKRLKKMVSRVFVFSVITSALRKIRSYISDVFSKNEELQKSFAQLKAAAMTLFQPVIEYLLPKVISLVQYLTRAFMTLASLVTRLFGTTVEEAAAAAKAISGVAEESDKATSSLAGFDQIQTISTESSSSSSSGQTAPDFEGIIGQELSEVEGLLTGLALVALGCILTFSGANILIGIAMIVAGAAMVYQSAKDDPQAIQSWLEEHTAAITILGVALVVIGIICMVCGQYLIGLGCIIAGAVALGYEAAANWDTIKEFISGATDITIAGVALVGIGIVALCAGMVPLGVGLIVVGAVALGYEAIANWDAVKEMLQDPIGLAVALIAGAALIVIGIMAAIGGFWLVAIPLIAIGAGFIVAAVAANWDAIVEALRGPIGLAVALISTALLVLGVILLFTGVGIPLGIGLILAGAAGLAATVYANWDFLVEKIKSIAGKAKDTIMSAINWVKEKFTAIKDWILGIFSSIGDFFSNIFGGIGDFFGGIWDKVTGFFSIEGEGTPVMPVPNVGNIGIPLAEGALVPPNREFLALLGDNKVEPELVSPVSTMKQAIKDALMEFGGMSGGDIHITVKLDGRVVAKNTVKHVNRMTREAGKPVLIG